MKGYWVSHVKFSEGLNRKHPKVARSPLEQWEFEDSILMFFCGMFGPFAFIMGHLTGRTILGDYY